MADETPKDVPQVPVVVKKKRTKHPNTGRKSKLTEEFIEHAVNILRTTSTPLSDIAEAAGIHRDTFFQWIRNGREGFDLEGRPTRAIEVRLYRLVTQARAEGTQNAVKKLRELATGTQDWRGIAWELERTRPNQFGLRVRVHVEDQLRASFDRLKATFAHDPPLLEKIMRSLAGEDVQPDGEQLEEGEDATAETGNRRVGFVHRGAGQGSLGGGGEEKQGGGGAARQPPAGPQPDRERGE